MSETLLLSCPKCGTRVRLREGELAGRCEACNAVVERSQAPSPAPRPAEGQGLTPTVVLVGSLLLIVAGAAAFRTMRRAAHGRNSTGPGSSHVDPSTAPPPTRASTPAPAGELAWEIDARSPVALTANADAVEDIFGFFRVWDGLSAWTSYGGVFDGATLAPIWRSEPIDPQILKRAGAAPTALAVGGRVVVSDTTPTLRVFDLASGKKLFTLLMADAVVDMCRAPDPALRVWVEVAGDQHALVDLDTGKAAFAPHPSWCALPEPKKEEAPWQKKQGVESADAAAQTRACKVDFRNAIAHAACVPGVEAPPLEGAAIRYMLKNGDGAVVLATKEDRPIAIGVGPGYKASWSTPLVTDDTKPVPEAPRVADLSDGKLYVVYAKVYFDARLAALDAASGARIWDVPLVGSMASSSLGDFGRGEARGLVASRSRVYVTRSGGGLDVFDATDGKAIGTIGKK